MKAIFCSNFEDERTFIDFVFVLHRSLCEFESMASIRKDMVSNNVNSAKDEINSLFQNRKILFYKGFYGSKSAERAKKTAGFTEFLQRFRTLTMEVSNEDMPQNELDEIRDSLDRGLVYSELRAGKDKLAEHHELEALKALARCEEYVIASYSKINPEIDGDAMKEASDLVLDLYRTVGDTLFQLERFNECLVYYKAVHSYTKSCTAHEKVIKAAKDDEKAEMYINYANDIVEVFGNKHKALDILLSALEAVSNEDRVNLMVAIQDVEGNDMSISANLSKLTSAQPVKPDVNGQSLRLVQEIIE